MGNLKAMGTDEAARMLAAVERAIGYAGTMGADAGIEASSTLNEMLANDSVLKHVDRKAAYQAFNDLSRTFPSMAEHPMVMLGLMRRALEDRADGDDAVALPPHESLQLASLESSLGDGRVPQKVAV